MWIYYSLFFALWTSILLVFIKKITRDINPLVYIVISSIFFLIVAFPIIYLTTGFPILSWEFFFLIFLSSILDAIAFLASTWAIKIAPISLISPIASFNPVFTTFFAIIGLAEVPNLQKLCGIVIVVIGAYLLNIVDAKKGLLVPFQKLFSNRGVQLFLLANFLWALTPILQKKAIFATSPHVPLFVSAFSGLLVLLFFLPFSLKKITVEKRFIKKHFFLFLIIAPLAVVGQFVAFTAFSIAPVGYVTAIFKLSTLFSVVLGVLFFHEKDFKERILGSAVMLVGTILLLI